MTIKDYDMVEVAADVPAENVKAGMRGMIIDVFSRPNHAYEVEFSDDSGQPVMQASLLPEQVKKLENLSCEDYIKQGRSRLYLLAQPKK